MPGNLGIPLARTGCVLISGLPVTCPAVVKQAMSVSAAVVLEFLAFLRPEPANLIKIVSQNFEFPSRVA